MARSRGQNPYSFLIWFGILVVALIGVTLYFGLKAAPPAPRGPERIALFFTQTGVPEPQRRDVVVLVEEGRGAGAGLTFLVLPAQLRIAAAPVPAVPGPGGGRAAARALEQALGAQVHYYAVIPDGVLSSLADLTGGLQAGGRTLDGRAAVAYLFGAPDVAGRMERAPELLLAVMDAAAAGQIQAGLGDLLALARQVETDLSLLELPDRFGRWGQLTPRVVGAPGQPAGAGAWELDVAATRALLHPDPDSLKQ